MNQKGLPKQREIWSEIGCTEEKSENSGFFGNTEKAEDFSFSNFNQEKFDDLFSEQNSSFDLKYNVFQSKTEDSKKSETNSRKDDVKKTDDGNEENDANRNGFDSVSDNANNESTDEKKSTTGLDLELPLDPPKKPQNMANSPNPVSNLGSNIINSNNVLINTTNPTSPISDSALHIGVNGTDSLLKNFGFNGMGQYDYSENGRIRADFGDGRFSLHENGASWPPSSFMGNGISYSAQNGEQQGYLSPSAQSDHFNGIMGYSSFDFAPSPNSASAQYGSQMDYYLPNDNKAETQKMSKEKSLSEQQLKMLQSVKMMQQNQLRSNEYLNHFDSAMTNPPISPMSPISPISPIVDSSFGNPRNCKINQNKSEQNNIDKFNRNYHVRKCADELTRLKPRYKIAINNLLKNGVEEAKTISDTVHLYSQILCNWKKQTTLVYSKMRQSLIVLTQRLESEMHQNHSNAVNYRKRIEDLTSRNNMMEFNFKGLQKKIMLQTRKRETKDGAAPDGEVLEKRKRKLESTRLELDEVRKKYQRVLGENRHLKMAGDKWKHKGGAIEKPSVATLEKEIVIAKTLIEQIMVLKNHQNILCLNDSKNLDSPLIKPDITNIFQRLRKCCGQLENNLGDEKTVEMFLSRSEDDFAKETPKDGFTVSQILDKRVSPEGKTQFYVCCPVNPVLAREAVLSGAGPSPVSIEEGSDPGALCERVWVDEQSLVGCETLIEKFRSARSIEGAVETKE